MILLAPDKYKGTLTAQEAASAMAEGFSPRPCLLAPMADGGEGTAQILASIVGAEKRDGYYLSADGTAYIDSSAHIGITPDRKARLLEASSYPLGQAVREILDMHPRVVIGIGGTGICDGGEGFMQALDIYGGKSAAIAYYRDRIIGLSDVCVPLISASGPSALTFAPQKGATEADLPILRCKLAKVQERYGNGKTSPYDGAGGGMGFAIATAIGAKCYPGAEYVLQAYGIDWSAIDMVVTGEGCIDDQTSLGKVVNVVAAQAYSHGIPCIAIGGMLRNPAPIPGCRILEATGPGTPAQRLQSAASGIS